MTWRTLVATVAASGLLVGAQARAQTSRVHIGPHVVMNHEKGEGNEWGLGPHITIPVMHRLEFYPSAEWFFNDAEEEGHHFNVNAEFKWRILGGRGQWLYGGGGISMARYGRPKGVTEAYESLMIGFESLRGKVHPFFEARAVFGYADVGYQLKGGLNFTLGKH